MNNSKARGERVLGVRANRCAGFIVQMVDEVFGGGLCLLRPNSLARVKM